MKLNLPDPKKIVFTYLLAGFLWLILTSEIFTLSGLNFRFLLYDKPGSLLFILFSAVILYFLLANYQNRLNLSLKKWQESERQFQNLYEQSPQPVWISGKDGEILFINNAAIKLFGFLPGEAPDVLPGEQTSGEGDQQSQYYPEKGEAGQRGIRKFVSQEGELLYLDLLIHSIRYQGKSARLVIGNNVTRLLQAEREKHRISNELIHYKKALDRSALLSVTDLNGIIIDVNPKFCEVSKFSAQELIGKSHNLINSGYHPPVFFQRMFRTVRQGEVWRGEVCNRAKDGNLFWVDMSIIPVMEGKSKAEKYMAIAYPVTDRKAAEIKSEKVQQELMTFMYKASHNLRGPVATLCGLINVARMEVNEDNALKYINLLNERTSHLEFTLGELIDITKIKQEDLAIDCIHFQAILDEVFDEFRDDTEKHHIQVNTLVQSPPNFRSDPKLLKRLFYYLIHNSIKFRNNENPCIDIQVRDQEEDGVLISVSDNGPGIEESIRPRIYEMYFRGSEKSNGSGLGLYIVNSIVERLGAYIHLQSKQGKGTTFTILLPDAREMEKHRSTESHTYLSDKHNRLPVSKWSSTKTVS